ncbi:MAG: PTS mannose transporter subunit IID [Thermaerobacter sp.]|nr:PTS mannose transporter subunit IID [Thermaerobacter sp.]
MTGLLLVSHSKRLADGLAELLRELSGSPVPMATVGGETVLGVDAAMVLSGVSELLAQGVDAILVLGDVGSSLFSAEAAIEMAAGSHRMKIADAPLVEGAIAAAMALSGGGALDDAFSAAEEASTIRKR